MEISRYCRVVLAIATLLGLARSEGKTRMNRVVCKWSNG